MTRVRVAGVGTCLPREALDNQALSAMVGELPPSILPEIGVTTRYWIARPGEEEHATSASRMAAEALSRAAESAGASAREVDLLVLSTSSPEYHLPGASTYVLDHVGAPRAATIELRAGCTGMPVALDIARSHLLAGRARTVAVVGVEAISPAIVGMVEGRGDKGLSIRQRLAAYTFGDGAGAVILTVEPGDRGPYTFVQGTLDATLPPGIRVVGGGTHLPVSQQDPSSLLRIDLDPKGSQIHGPEVLAACVDHLRAVGRGLESVDHIVLPEGEAEYFAAQVVSGAVDVDPRHYREKVRQNLDDVGATGSAAVSLALADSLARREISDGEGVLLLGIEGARYQYAAIAADWPHL